MNTEGYELKLTSKEVGMMFKNMIKGWFKEYVLEFNDFVSALLIEYVEAINK